MDKNAKSAAAVDLSGKSKEDLLNMVISKEITPHEYEVARAALETSRKITCRANPDNGSISMYGVQHPYPVTLYPAQWERVFAEGMSVVQAFIAEHRDYLPAAKGVEPKKPVPKELIGDGKPFRKPVKKEEAPKE